MTRRPALLRLAIGLAISAVFLGVTLSRVDLPKAATAIASASLPGLLAALVVVLVDLALRALRWRVLLDGLSGGTGAPSYRLTFGYLTIGFVANAVLPARLGDVARAFLAGNAFGVSRLAIFGTILVERVSDGLTFLILAFLSGLAVGLATGIRDLVVFGAAIAAAGALGAAVAWLVLVRTRVGSSRLGSIAADLGARLGGGAGALRSGRSAVAVVGLTIVVATTATVVGWFVANAVGLTLTPLQTVLFVSGIALSLAIPAAPGSIGTYEFVGVTVVTGLGYSAEQGLATILLMRVLTTFPPVIAGLISLWALQIRPASLVAAPRAMAADR